MKKKICIFCSLSSFNTGMPISTYKLAKGLADSGRFDVRVVLPEDGELSRRLREASVETIIIPFNRLRSGYRQILGFALSYVRAGFKFVKFIKKNNIDAVHFSDIIDAPFYPLAWLAGAKVVGHVRVCAGRPFVRRLFGIWASVFCSRVVVISAFAKRYYGLGGKRAPVVYNPGPDRQLFDPENYSGGMKDISCIPDTASNDIPAVIAVSMFRREKGLHNFLEIASRIRARVPGVRFVIAGGAVKGHEKYYDGIMEDIKRRKLEGCLTVTGGIPHERVPALMAGAAALVHAPDWEETLGGVILEAMAMGVTPVAYNCGGVGECFTDGVSGFLIRRGDYDGAADRVVSLLESADLRNRTAASARAELDSKFTLALYINNIEKIYGDVLAAGGRDD